ncbi:MAG: exodeoxyribonuclease III [Myxococcota bacterium]
MPRRLFRVYSWNVNGIRSVAQKGLFDWLGKARADVVAMQETRAHPEQLTPELRKPPRWRSHFVAAERKGYSGVGLYARRAPDAVESSLGDAAMDAEGRVQIARFGALTIANVYFPNGSGKNRDNGRVPFKLAFYRRLFDHLEAERARGGRVLVLGDFNTAHRDIDLARPKGNAKTSGFLPEEREELDRWLRSGWTDTYRARHGDREGAYTWWSQRFGVRERNVGWRIDMVLASPGVMPFLLEARIHPNVMGSDHCPISVDLAPNVTESEG